ncbi:MAG: Fic family protein [Desulfuromusa sp.]|nr:Fic family protein [Desulfuromusa sp.]
MTSARYDTTGLSENQYEPGSDGSVLKNLLGIKTQAEMEIVETTELLRTSEQLLEEVTEDQVFTVQDVCAMHRLWFGSLYPWAGQYRQVNISKSGFTFAMAHTIAELMAVFEREQLRCFTPCQFSSRSEIAHALAKVHVEN